MFGNSSNSSGVMQKSATFIIYLLWPSSSNKQSMPHETYSPYEVSKGGDDKPKAPPGLGVLLQWQRPVPYETKFNVATTGFCRPTSPVS